MEVGLTKDQTPTMEDIQQAKYARNCLQKCNNSCVTISLIANIDHFFTALRLHPVVPVNQRWAKADNVLPRGEGRDGQSPVAPPRGSNVCIAVYSMHRRKDIYGEDADVFRPERWEDLHPVGRLLHSEAAHGCALGKSSL